MPGVAAVARRRPQRRQAEKENGRDDEEQQVLEQLELVVQGDTLVKVGPARRGPVKPGEVHAADPDAREDPPFIARIPRGEGRNGGAEHRDDADHERRGKGQARAGPSCPGRGRIRQG